MFACSEETLSKELINLTLNMLEGGRASHVLTSCVLQGYRAKRLAVPHRLEEKVGELGAYAWASAQRRHPSSFPFVRPHTPALIA